MRTNVRPAPASLAPKPPPPPLPPILLLLRLPSPTVRPRIPLTDRPADDNSMPIIPHRRPHETEPVQARGDHVMRRAEQDRGGPQRRVEQPIRSEDGPSKGKIGNAQVIPQDDRNAANDQRCDADQIDERVHEKSRVIPRLPRRLALEPGRLGRVQPALRHVAAAALLAPEGEEDDGVEAEGERDGDDDPEVVRPEAPGVVLGADPALHARGSRSAFRNTRSSLWRRLGLDGWMHAPKH